MTAIVYGPTPNGTDDTAALQAFFDSICGTSGVSNYGILQAGTYRCLSSITIGGTAVKTGWHIRGAGDGATQIAFDTSSGLSYGIGITGAGAWRCCKLSDLRIQGIQTAGSEIPIGIKFLDCSWSGMQLDNINFDSFNTCIYSAAGGYGNGEFLHVSNCRFTNCLTVYNQENGQSFCQTFDCCGISARANAVLFNLCSASSGGGITLRDVQCTMASDGVHASNSIMFNINGNGQPINVIGGRWEHLTTLAQGNQGGYGVVTSLNMMGTAITTDYATADTLMTQLGFVWQAGTGACPFDINMIGCWLAPCSWATNPLLFSGHWGYKGIFRMIGGSFSGYTGPPVIAPNFYNWTGAESLSSAVHFDCWRDNTIHYHG